VPVGGSHPTRTEATVGLILAVAWFALSAQEATSYPWSQGDDFQMVAQTIHWTLSGLIAIVGVVWLAGLGRGVLRT
jgi:hypothetical protein